MAQLAAIVLEVFEELDRLLTTGTGKAGVAPDVFVFGFWDPLWALISNLAYQY